MPVISGGKIVEGARHRGAADMNADGALGPYVNAGVPVDGAAGTQFGVAAKGALLIDTTNANVYINAGTLAVPVWKLITRAA